MHRHQRGQPALLDERHADGRADADVQEGLGCFGRQFGADVLHHQGFARAEIGDREAAEIGEAVMADDAGRTFRAPVAADGEVILVGLHVRISADRDAEVLAEEAGGDRHHSVGVGRRGDRLAEPVEEAEALLAVAQRAFRAQSFHCHAGAVGNLADERQLVRRPAARLGVIEIEQRNEATLLGDRHVDHRLRADCLERLGAICRARIGLGILENDGLAALQVFYV